MQEAAWGLARYARITQEAGLCPIVEPEILMDGDHDIATTAAVQERVIAAVYKACNDNGVYLEGSLLKPSMTVPGVDCKTKSDPEEVAKYTIQTLERTVPASVPGVTFLSGGLSEEDASIFLNTMNQQKRVGPWSLTFSYSRAMQSSTLKKWGTYIIHACIHFVRFGRSFFPVQNQPTVHHFTHPLIGSFMQSINRSIDQSINRRCRQSINPSTINPAGKPDNVKAAQDQLIARAIANSEANLGKYVPGSQPSDQESLYVKNYQY